MAKYRITAPDGSVFEVTAPDDATEEQVLAYAQQQFASQPQTPPKTAEELTPGLSTDPTDRMGGVERFVASYGGAMPALLDGAKQRFMDVASLATPSYAVGAMDHYRKGLEQQTDERRELERPLMNTGAGFAGSLAGNLAPMLAVPSAAPLTLGRAAPYLDAIGQGAAFGYLQPTGEGDSVAMNTTAGGALGAAGQGVASGLSTLAQKSQLPEMMRRGIESARAAGIPLNAAQTTSSPSVRALQAVTRWLPFSGASKAGQAQQEAFNRAVGKSFGVDNAPLLTDDVMRQARESLSSKFSDIYDRNNVGVTPDVARRLLEIEREAGETMIPDHAQVVKNQIERIIREAEEGEMPGRMYQSLRTKIQEVERQGGEVGRLVKAVRKELDDAAVQSVSPDDAATLAKIRSQWANLRTAEDALKQVAGAGGNVRPAALWPLIRKGSTKEMRELARIGNSVLKDSVPDSGTAQRTLYQSLLTGGAGVAGGIPAAAALYGKMALTGATVGRAMNSNTASKLLQQGRPTSALAKLAKPLPKVLPLMAPGVASAGLDVGTVYGYDPSDPRYRGD